MTTTPPPPHRALTAARGHLRHLRRVHRLGFRFRQLGIGVVRLVIGLFLLGFANGAWDVAA